LKRRAQWLWSSLAAGRRRDGTIASHADPAFHIFRPGSLGSAVGHRQELNAGVVVARSLFNALTLLAVTERTFLSAALCFPPDELASEEINDFGLPA
jgi:hypothetical protein